MNERIKELYDQCWFGNDTAVYHKDLSIDTSMGYCFDTEKFAELIIGHATECVRDVLRDENSDLSYVAATQVQNRIKEHFGVEE
jgi:hypothetical protein